MSKICLIDGDSIPYLVSGSSEIQQRFWYVAEDEESPPLASFSGRNGKKEAVAWATAFGLTAENCYNGCTLLPDADVKLREYTDAYLELIFKRTESDRYKLFIGGEGNFRKDLYPEYKANRKNLMKPLLYDVCVDYLKSNYGAVPVDDMEAEDAVGIATSEYSDCVIVHIDKDLNQLPGTHYDFKKDVLYEIDEYNAYYNLYKQVIMGDATDNIPGLAGYGEKKAEKALQQCSYPEQMWSVCLELYNNKAAANLTASLVYLLREQDDKWKAPF